MTFLLPRSIFPAAAIAACVFTLSACTPQYDWREVHGSDFPFSVLLPAKPLTIARPLNLGGIAVTMSMTAAEAGDTTFAVGSAQLPEAAQAQTALAAMKTALVNNINGSVRLEKTLALPQQAGITVEIEAVGNRSGSTQKLLLMARFTAKENRVYQLVVVGPEKSVSREAADTFFTSFKFN